MQAIGARGCAGLLGVGLPDRGCVVLCRVIGAVGSVGYGLLVAVLTVVSAKLTLLLGYDRGCWLRVLG